ncbi:T9SS type A sorting domain-containing protein [Nostoc ellipsosporum NOK]|nr:T9SS type A sorting domain-containing protein [Nostoc ellipsosporum NOK]
MRKLYHLFLAVLCLAATTVRSQNTANYGFSTTTTGSLTNMSSGTTQLIAANSDDVASAVTDIGFDFYFQGARYAQFSVNSNGTLRLGAVAVGTTLYAPLAQSAQALISAYGADQRVHTTGKVHYRVTGSAPNRKLIIEWLNMQADFNSGGTANLTYQVSLSETTGTIDFAYGSMSMSTLGAADANSSTPQIGFSSGNTAGNVGSVTAAQSGTPAPSYNGASASPVNNAFTAGAIPVLTSTADGSRRTFSFASPVPLAPSALSFTAVTPTGMTLNWTDNATNEAGYVIYRSTDGTNYTFAGQVAANATSLVQTGLSENTSYQWRVYALTEGALSTALSGVQSTSIAGVISSNGTGGGLWSATSTWVGGVVPSINDKVSIVNGDVVTIDVAANAYELTIGGGASTTLQYEAITARTLTVYNNVTVSANAIFQSATSGTQTGHLLSVGSNLVNNGTLDFSTATDAAGASITFTGANDNTFSGSGTVTDIRQITVNKGTSSAPVIELNAANFSVRGSVIDNVTGGFLTLTNGTFKISGTFTYTGRMFSAAAYTIPATSGVWLNNPNFTIAAQTGNVVNNGVLRVSSGTWSIGTTNTTTVTGAAGASFIVNGGTLNIAGRFNPSTAITYTQTGGVVNVATVGNSGSGTTNGSFTIPGTATFNMSGGNINLVQASTGATPIDWIATNTAFNYTGGTVTTGTGATTTNFNFRLRGNLPGLIVDNTTNNKTATATSQVNLNGPTTINSGATFVISGQVCLVLGSPFTNNGTLTGTTTNTRFYFLTNNGAITYTGTGTVTAPLTSFEVDNTAGVVIDPSVNQIITARFNNFSGGLTNSGKLTIGNGGTSSAIIQIGVTGVSSPIYGFDVPPVFNIGTGGLQVIYGPELSARTTGNEIPPSRTVAVLSAGNPNGIVINGGDITTSTLTMSTGNITTGSNTLVLGTSATALGTYSYTAGTIVGRFKRWIGTATGNFDFPVGIATAKRNASINFTTANTTGGSLTTEWVSSPGGNNGLPLTEGATTITNTSNDGFWRVVSGDGLTGGSYTGTFTATGIAGVTDPTQLVLTKRANTSSPWVFDGTHVTTTGTAAAPVLSRTGMSGFSEFGIGGTFVLLPVNLLTFSGEKTGGVNQLYWTTASEQNNKGFEVQRSLNGTDYTVLGFVNTQATGGNSGVKLDYSYTDAAPTGTTQYYRLRQVDQDGRSKYSNVIQIKGTPASRLSISSVYPNPASNEITISMSSPVRSTVTVSILNMSGQVMGQQVISIGTGSNSLPVNISKLPAGYYMFKLTSESGSAVTRFIKQ